MRPIYYILFLLLVLNVYGQDLENFLSKIEASLLTHKEKFLEAYKNRCHSTCSCSRSTCHSKFTTEPECHSDFGINKTSCPICGGRLLSFEESSILYPEGASQTMDECWTSELDNSWKKTVSKSIKWQYLAFTNGHSRTFPGRRDDCRGGKNFDPKARPWFNAAISGPKYVALMIDISGSMMNDNKMDYAKKAAIQVLSSLGSFDEFGVIAFSDSTKVMIGTTALRVATTSKDDIDQTVEGINSLIPNGGSNFILAFQEAFSVFQHSPYCNKVVLFLSDGEDTFSIPSSIYKQIALLNKEVNASIFTFSLGKDASDTVLKEIACQNNGIWFKSEDPQNIITQITQYSLYYSLRNTSIPIWTAPYEDMNGAGEVATVSIAIYDESVNPSYLIGVLGMDISAEEMRRYTTTDNEISARLEERSVKCTKVSPTICDLEILRQKLSISDKSSLPPTCTNQNCIQELPTPCTSLPFIPDYCQTSEYNIDEACCKCFPSGAVVGIVIGSVSGIILIIVNATIGIKYAKKKQNTQSSSLPSFPPPFSSPSYPSFSQFQVGNSSSNQVENPVEEVEMEEHQLPPYSES